MKERARQLDGFRAVAMMAICWDHWRPSGWSREFPFEVFLFFFLVLSGYLITGSLLKERERYEGVDAPWKIKALKNYQVRRGLRILVPYYLALILALLLGATDLRTNFSWYFFHLSNFHMATLDHWPPGTNHFWSLAIQQQFYLIWPFVMWFTPRRWLVFAMVSFTLVGPISRFFYDAFLHWFASPQLLTWMSFDYFGVGALLAWAVKRKMLWNSLRMKWVWGIGLVGYCLFMTAGHYGVDTKGFRALQQTFLAMALCGVIASGSHGIKGWGAILFENTAIQKIGELSYGIYLFHNLAPMVSGKLFWFLWSDPFNNSFGALLRIATYAGITWGLALACWKWIEFPMQQMRERLRPALKITERL